AERRPLLPLAPTMDGREREGAAPVIPCERYPVRQRPRARQRDQRRGWQAGGYDHRAVVTALVSGTNGDRNPPRLEIVPLWRDLVRRVSAHGDDRRVERVLAASIPGEQSQGILLGLRVVRQHDRPVRRCLETG